MVTSWRTLFLPSFSHCCWCDTCNFFFGNMGCGRAPTGLCSRVLSPPSLGGGGSHRAVTRLCRPPQKNYTCALSWVESPVGGQYNSIRFLASLTVQGSPGVLPDKDEFQESCFGGSMTRRFGLCGPTAHPAASTEVEATCTRPNKAQITTFGSTSTGGGGSIT